VGREREDWRKKKSNPGGKKEKKKGGEVRPETLGKKYRAGKKINDVKPRRDSTPRGGKGRGGKKGRGKGRGGGGGPKENPFARRTNTSPQGKYVMTRREGVNDGRGKGKKS